MSYRAARAGRHWYDLSNARTAIGVTQDGRTLVLFTVDGTNGGHGMQVGEVADLLTNDYGVWNALNLDGGGSTTMAIEDPGTHLRKLVNVPADNPPGWSPPDAAGCRRARSRASASASLGLRSPSWWSRRRPG